MIGSRETSRPWFAGPGPWVALVLVGLGLFLLRPASPFEWDEVLYQRALDGYDVARHSPHPPGAPAFIWAADAVRLVVSDPQLAVQLVTIACALGGLLLVVGLLRREGGAELPALAAAAILLAIPAFPFYANVGLSDVPAMAGLLASVLVCLRALDEGRYLPVAAAVVAVAVGVRPQLLPALLPVGLAAIVSAVRRRAWRHLAVALAVGIAVSAAIWVPAVVKTGFGRYRQALADHSRYWIEVEKPLRLPGAPLRPVARQWLVAPLGAPLMAWAFWGLAAFGAVAWWRNGRRRLVVVAGGTALVYLVSAAFAMNLNASVRYSLPALALAALLVAGVLVVRPRWARVVAGGVLVAWGAAALSWAWPALALRRAPAPVWAALEWTRQHCDPSRTTVIYDGAYTPHAQYVLERAGFPIEQAVGDRIYSPGTGSRRDLILIKPWPVPGAEVVFEKVWPPPALAQLTMGRYERSTVMRVPVGALPRFSPAFSVEDEGLVLWATGRVEVAEGLPPLATKVCPLSFPVTLERPGAPPTRIERGSCVAVTLTPGNAGWIKVSAPKNLHALLRPMFFTPVS